MNQLCATATSQTPTLAPRFVVNGPLFPLGRLTTTPNALAAITAAGQTPQELLTRHVTGDWADMSEDDRASNQESIEHGSRILSAYQLNSGKRLYIITEADRSVTTLLLPEEY